MTYEQFAALFTMSTCPIDEEELHALQTFMHDKMIIDIVLNAPYLTHLNFSNRRLLGNQAIALYKLIQNNVRLTSLDISDNLRLDNEDLTLPFHLLGKMSQLRVLDLTGVNIASMDELAKCTSLTDISLSNPNRAKPLASLLRNSLLTQLTLGERGGEHSFSNEYLLLRNSTRLRSITLYCYAHSFHSPIYAKPLVWHDTDGMPIHAITLRDFWPEDAKLGGPAMVNYFGSMTQLMELDISDTRAINSNSFKRLSALPCLRALNISKIRGVSSAAIRALIELDKLYCLKMDGGSAEISIVDAIARTSRLTSLSATCIFNDNPSQIEQLAINKWVAQLCATSTLRALSFCNPLTFANYSDFMRSTTLQQLRLFANAWKSNPVDNADLMRHCRIPSLAVAMTRNQDAPTHDSLVTVLDSMRHVRKLWLDKGLFKQCDLTTDAPLYPFFSNNQELTVLSIGYNDVYDARLDEKLYYNRHYLKIIFEMMLVLAPLTLPMIILKEIFSFLPPFNRDFAGQENIDSYRISQFGISVGRIWAARRAVAVENDMQHARPSP